MRAMYAAPEGKTPCESAYNAFKAADDLARSGHARAVIVHLASREDFLARCAALAPKVQSCMVPAYMARHREECEAARPAPEVLKPMVELTTPGGGGAAEPKERP